ncbi:YeiH family protein [Streptomyces sp. JJ38]|uniref:YeiH family protein n=1 Tax=Streptomyces sp. JJ38 TaxID=2738128 RepID=UPI001C5A36DE|nr:putative sulfate exporter family transporter [Streptomyces sp. JJ38]MBW1599952.1 putative sulfate exporter family transporter [Streptomyces sp. JJ38]
MAVPLTRAARGPSGAPRPRRTAPPWPGLALVAGGVAAAWGVHRLLPAVPLLTAAIVLGLLVAHLPRAGGFTRGRGRPGLSLAGRRFMRLGVVLLGLELSLAEVLDLGWATAAMVLGVVVATFFGTIWLGRRVGLTGDQPLLVATGYSICGASAIGAVSEVRRSDERDVAASVALVTLCGTLAIAVLPLLHQPLGLGDAEFGRWVGAGVHDVGQVVATAQTAGQEALGEAVLVKLMRVVLLAPLVAVLAAAVARRRFAAAAGPEEAGAGGAAGGGPAPRRPPLVPLFVAGFLASAALRTTGVLPEGLLEGAATLREGLLAAALFGLGSGVFLPSLARTGWRMAAVGSGSWVVIAGLSYVGVLLTA